MLDVDISVNKQTQNAHVCMCMELPFLTFMRSGEFGLVYDFFYHLFFQFSS